MNIALWIVTGLLALVFLAAGAMKLAKSKSELTDQGMDWVDDFGPGTVKLIGAVEVLAAVGLVLPPLVGVAPVLAPLAAAGLVLVMAGAIVFHAGRREARNVVFNVVLLALAAVVVWGRLGPEQFTA